MILDFEKQVKAYMRKLHKHKECRPCTYNNWGGDGCKKDDDCEYCHAWHDVKYIKKAKKVYKAEKRYEMDIKKKAVML